MSNCVTKIWFWQFVTAQRFTKREISKCLRATRVHDYGWIRAAQIGVKRQLAELSLVFSVYAQYARPIGYRECPKQQIKEDTILIS